MSKLINSQKIKDNLVLTKHGITRLNERISKAYFSKLKNTSIKDKIKHTLLEKYGVEFAQQSEKIQQTKKKQTQCMFFS